MSSATPKTELFRFSMGSFCTDVTQMMRNSPNNQALFKTKAFHAKCRSQIDWDNEAKKMEKISKRSVEREKNKIKFESH